jgi:hypothetical protein
LPLTPRFGDQFEGQNVGASPFPNFLAAAGTHEAVLIHAWNLLLRDEVQGPAIGAFEFLSRYFWRHCSAVLLTGLEARALLRAFAYFLHLTLQVASSILIVFNNIE